MSTRDTAVSRPALSPDPAGAPGAVLVLSVMSSALEDRIAAAGEAPVVVAMPTANVPARRAMEPTYAVRGVADWDDLDAMLRLAHHVHAEGPLATVVPALEPAVVPAAFVRTMMGIGGAISFETALRCTDKHLMKTALEASQLPVAAHQLARCAADVVLVAAELGGFPLVIKPRSGFGAINTHVVRSPAEVWRLDAAGVFEHGVEDGLATPLTGTGVGAGLATHVGGFLVERCVDVKAEYHCEVLVVDGDIAYAIPGMYLEPLISDSPVLGSVLLDSDSMTGTLVRHLAVDAVHALGIDNGFAHVELLKDVTDRWFIGEVAARRGGAALPALMNLAYGIDSVDLDARWAAGHPPAPPVAAPSHVFGWSGVRIPRPGRVTQISTRERILTDPAVVDAAVMVKVGQTVAPGGSGMFAGYVFYRGENTADVLAAMLTTAQRLDLRVENDRLAGAGVTAVR